jgi:CheY-like chemotaxis protein
VGAFTGEGGIIKVATVRHDLILMDIKLPGIDGFETTEKPFDSLTIMDNIMEMIKATK